MKTHKLFNDEVTPRQTFECYGRWVQPLITFLSGVPGRNEKPLITITPLGAIVIDLCKVASGVSLGCLVLTLGQYVLVGLPLCWLLLVNGARSLASDAHYAGHACVTGKPAIDTWIGEFLSTLVLSTNMREYAPGHNMLHHGRNGISTLEDPDARLVLALGYKPGQKMDWYVRRLFTSLVSPFYHAQYLWARLQSNFISAHPLRLLLSWTIHGSALIVVWHFEFWNAYLLGWLVPMVLLYAISAALQFPSEHLWLREKDEGQARGDHFRKMSHGRFFLAPAPRQNLNLRLKLFAWIIWSVRMVPLIFGRFFVCVSILPAHDYHHRHARVMDWPMEPYLRAQEIEAGAQGYLEYYGLWRVYIDQFRIWSKQNTWHSKAKP
ncbi:MAG: fatty acid desaturase [Rhodospirillaceae bacterium]|nr:MAG: fatty acid desaturase [Rhodospirillaceae bacterium]